MDCAGRAGAATALSGACGGWCIRKLFVLAKAGSRCFAPAVEDTLALVRALQTKRIAGAGLDVFEREPQLEFGLCELENVVHAPPLGSATLCTRTKMDLIAVDNLLAVCTGQRPPNCVNPQVLG